jgi:hypothetical protein
MVEHHRLSIPAHLHLGSVVLRLLNRRTAGRTKCRSRRESSRVEVENVRSEDTVISLPIIVVLMVPKFYPPIARFFSSVLMSSGAERPVSRHFLPRSRSSMRHPRAP